MRIPLLVSIAALSLTASIATPGAQAPAPKFTIDDLVKIKHPSGHQWAPDGSHVWFTYNDGGVNNVWAVATDGKSSPVALTNYPDGQAGGGGFWSKDGKTFFYQRGGGLLSVPVTGGTPRPAWPSAERAGGFSLSPDGTRVAFIVGQGGGGGGRGGRGGGRGGGAAAANPAPAPAAPASADLIVHTIATDSDQKIA